MRRSEPYSDSESAASRLRVTESLDRWHWWLMKIREKAARVPVHVGSDIWDEDVIPLRQPIEECE